MKHTLTILFSVFFLSAFSQAIYYPQIYPYSVAPGRVVPSNNIDAYRNRFVVTVDGTDSVWAFVDVKGKACFLNSNASVDSGVVNVVPPLDGDGSIGNPLQIVPGSDSLQILVFDGANWVIVDASDISDRDWLENDNNLPPDNIRDTMYTLSKSSFGARYLFPGSDVGIIDSLNHADLVLSGNRDAAVTYYNNLTGAWSQTLQTGSVSETLLGPGAVQYSVYGASGGTPVAPTGPFRQYMTILQADSSVTLPRYRNTRIDSGTPVNFLGTNSSGKIQSYSVDSLSGGGGFFANQGVTKTSVGDTVQLGKQDNGSFDFVTNDITGPRIVVSHDTSSILTGQPWSAISFNNNANSGGGFSIVTGEDSMDVIAGLNFDSLGASYSLFSQYGDSQDFYSQNSTGYYGEIYMQPGNIDIYSQKIGTTNRMNMRPDSTVFDKKAVLSFSQTSPTVSELITRRYADDSIQNTFYPVDEITPLPDPGIYGLVRGDIAKKLNSPIDSSFTVYTYAVPQGWVKIADGFEAPQAPVVTLYTGDGNILANDNRDVGIDSSAYIHINYPNGISAFGVNGGSDSSATGASVFVGSPNGSNYFISDATRAFVAYTFPSGTGTFGFDEGVGGGLMVKENGVLPSPGQTLIAGSDQTFYFGDFPATVTADNGLTKTVDNIQLGGPLIQYTIIDAGSGSNALEIDGAKNSGSLGCFRVDNSGGTGLAVRFISGGRGLTVQGANNEDGIVTTATGNGDGVNSTSTGNGDGLDGTALGGTGTGVRGTADANNVLATGVWGHVSTGNALYGQCSAGGLPLALQATPAVVNTVHTMAQIKLNSSVAVSAGVGASLDFILPGALPSNQIKSTFSNTGILTRTSSLIFTGIDNTTPKDNFTLSGTGQLRLNQYGAGTFTGTAATVPKYATDGTVVESFAPAQGSFSQVGAATTVFTVTIGTTQPNATYNVQVTPTAALSAALFYVTNKTITTFDVTYLAGLTGTVTFDWLVTNP